MGRATEMVPTESCVVEVKSEEDQNVKIKKWRCLVGTSNRWKETSFQRRLDLPNLDKIKQLESEYFMNPIPKKPSFACAIVAIVVGALMILSPTGVDVEGEISGGITLIVAGYIWYRLTKKKCEKVEDEIKLRLAKREKS